MVLTSARAAHIVVLLLSVTVLPARPAVAQSPLSLSEAIRRARTNNPDAGLAAAAEREAADRVTQARGRYFPTVDVAESWQRGNQPVFVFSSLLAARQFTATDLALDALNHPAAMSTFRAAVSIEQPLFDRTTPANVRAAQIERDMAGNTRRLVAQDLTSTVTEAFGRVLVAAATVRSAAAAVETARADRELAGHRRDAGRVTDADVLQLDVYLTRTLEQQVEAAADARIARAQLNQLMGEPLTAEFSLEPALAADTIDITNAAGLEEAAVQHRPEVALARQQEQLAATAVTAAQAAFLPQVSAQAGWELNGASWTSRSPGWIVGVTGRINVLRGFADRGRLAEAREHTARQGIETRKAETLVRLDVQIAIARLEAAQASEAVGRAAADAARASHHIVRDRYESGLTDAATLLRAAEAIQQADTRRIEGLVHVMTATATLERATGRL